MPPRIASIEGAIERLRALAYQGALRRYGTVAPITRERLEHELRIIQLKGFAESQKMRFLLWNQRATAPAA